MKKLILSLLYPFWFFLARTIIGHVIMISVVFFLPFILINTLPGFENLHGDVAESVGIGIAIFSLLLSHLLASILIDISKYLETNYKSYSYKV